MPIVSTLVVLAIAALHLYFLVLEMFLWERPIGLKAFSQTRESAKASRVLAANQGLYNGFLAAGLIWGAIAGANGLAIRLFFLICVLVAGIFGGLTANRRILIIQALPAIVGIILVAL